MWPEVAGIIFYPPGRPGGRVVALPSGITKHNMNSIMNIRMKTTLVCRWNHGDKTNCAPFSAVGKKVMHMGINTPAAGSVAGDKKAIKTIPAIIPALIHKRMHRMSAAI